MPEPRAALLGTFTVTRRGTVIFQQVWFLRNYLCSSRLTMSCVYVGAVFRAPHESAVAAFDELADHQLCLDLIWIRDDVFGIRAKGERRRGCLDQIASNLSQRFHVAFTLWYDSVFGGFVFSVFVHGRLYASLRTDNGKEDDQWLDPAGIAYELGPPQVLASNGSLLTRPLPTLPGPRDAGRDCDLSVAASVLGVAPLGADAEDLFLWESVSRSIRRNYS